MSRVRVLLLASALAATAAALALPAPPAAARVVRPIAQPEAAPPRPPFWARVKDPHGHEIAVLVGRALFLRGNIASQYYEPHLLPTRRAVLREALDFYERALALDGERTDLRLEAAHTAFEAGEWARAAAHYRAAREAGGELGLPGATSFAEALLHMGLYAEAADELDAAVLGAVAYERGRLLALLGYAFMAQGRLDDAVDAVERGIAVSSSSMGAGGQPTDQMALAILAVAYDRDEQLGHAHDTIDDLRAMDPNFYFLWAPPIVIGQAPPTARYYIPYAPAADQHYFMGLFYEAQGRWTEAAAAWRAYLGSQQPLYARRARAHLDAADKALAEAAKARAAAKKKGAGVPGGGVHNPPPRPRRHP